VGLALLESTWRGLFERILEVVEAFFVRPDSAAAKPNRSYVLKPSGTS